MNKHLMAQMYGERYDSIFLYTKNMSHVSSLLKGNPGWSASDANASVRSLTCQFKLRTPPWLGCESIQCMSCFRNISTKSHGVVLEIEWTPISRSGCPLISLYKSCAVIVSYLKSYWSPYFSSIYDSASFKAVDSEKLSPPRNTPILTFLLTGGLYSRLAFFMVKVKLWLKLIKCIFISSKFGQTSKKCIY